MKLYLVRHCEAENKDLEIYKEVPNELILLTDEGRKQAERVAEKIKQYYDADPSPLLVCPVVIFSSPYSRALETAECIKKRFDHSRFFVDPLLIEHNFGIGTGYASVPDFIESRGEKELREQSELLFKCGNFFYKLPQGESRCDVALRAEVFLQKILRYPVASIVVISHKGLCECLHGRIVDKQEIDDWENGEVRVYEDAGEFGGFKEIERFSHKENDVEHIKSGRWVRMKTASSLPEDVKITCEEIKNEDHDWTMFKSEDGQMWNVAKHWEDETSFTVVASVVKYETDIIADQDYYCKNRKHRPEEYEL